MINRSGLPINVFFSSFTTQASSNYHSKGFVKHFNNKLEIRAGVAANSRDILYLLSAFRTFSA